MSALAPATQAGARSTTASGRFLIHGVQFVVETDVKRAWQAVHESYRAFWQSDPLPLASTPRLRLWRVPTGYRLVAPSGRTHEVDDEDVAVVALLDLVTRQLHEGLASLGILGIHAGAIELDGRAVFMSGPSGRGKSTLTLGLLRRGAGWLTDELTLIAPDDATILPFPRGLHVRPATLELVPELDFLRERPRQELGGGSEWSVGAADLARAFGTRIAAATPLAGILLLDGIPDPARPARIESMPPALATMELLRGTPAAAVDFTATMERLSGVTTKVRTARLAVGELDKTATAIIDWLGSSR
jgi:hypothetical protein